MDDQDKNRYYEDCEDCGVNHAEQDGSLYGSVESEFSNLTNLIEYQSEMLFDLSRNLDKILFPNCSKNGKCEDGWKENPEDETMWKLFETLERRIRDNNERLKNTLERTKK